MFKKIFITTAISTAALTVIWASASAKPGELSMYGRQVDPSIKVYTADGQAIAGKQAAALISEAKRRLAIRTAKILNQQSQLGRTLSPSEIAVLSNQIGIQKESDTVFAIWDLKKAPERRGGEGLLARPSVSLMSIIDLRPSEDRAPEHKAYQLEVEIEKQKAKAANDEQLRREQQIKLDRLNTDPGAS